MTSKLIKSMQTAQLFLEIKIKLLDYSCYEQESNFAKPWDESKAGILLPANF